MGRHSPHTNQPNRRIPRPWQSRSPNRSLRALGDFGRFDAGVSAERGLVVFALNGHGLPALTNPRPALFERSQSGGNPRMFYVAHSEDATPNHLTDTTRRGHTNEESILLSSKSVNRYSNGQMDVLPPHEHRPRFATRRKNSFPDLQSSGLSIRRSGQQSDDPRMR